MRQIFSPVGRIFRGFGYLPPATLAGIGVGLIVIVVGGSIYRTQRALTVAVASSQSVLVNGPLKVEFNQDVAAGFTTTIVPALPGSWHQVRSVLGVSAITFTPDKRFEAGRPYALHITGMKRAVTGAVIGDFKEPFTAQLPSGVKQTAPAAGAKDIPVKPRLTVILRDPNQGVRDLKPSLSPAVALKLVSTDDRTFVWEPVTPLKQGTAYSFALEDTRITIPEKRNLFTNIFTTVGAPVITSVREGGFFAPGQTVDIVFGQPMEQTAAGFTFGLPGKGSWVDDHTYRYVPTTEALKPGTSYSYVIKAGLKSKASGVVEADRSLAFATNGAVGASISPGGGNVALNSPIHVAFDQPVDHASAQARFSVAPGVGGSFSWAGNIMTYTPTALAYQTTYSVRVAPGVVPTWGLPNTGALSGTLATLPETIKLGVPMYKTQYRMSCELASLRMLLGFRGINVSDWDILMKIGYNPRPRDQATNTWDNPNLTYVGDLGGMPNSTGYGVHAGPIAAAAQSYGHNAVASFNVSAAYISARIHEGNPVEFWGHSTPSKADSWNTSTGVVQTWVSSHARVVYGVVGSADAPLGFWIVESMTAKPFYWTTDQLMANMNVDPGVSNQTVVVY